MTNKDERNAFMAYAKDFVLQGTKPNSTMRSGFSFVDMSRLCEIARAIHRIDENSCNGYHSESAEKRDNMKETRLLKEAQTIAKEYDFILFHQGDPRGWPLDLIPIGTLTAQLMILEGLEKLEKLTRGNIPVGRKLEYSGP